MTDQINCADAQADLSLLWAHISGGAFSQVADYVFHLGFLGLKPALGDICSLANYSIA